MKISRVDLPVDGAEQAVYAWALGSDNMLRIEGPLARTPRRRRQIRLVFGTLPLALQDALCDDGGVVRPPLVFGRRVFRLLHSDASNGFLIDLTRQRAAIRALASQVRWLEEGVDALPEAFVLYDAEDRLLLANSQYSRLYPTIAPILRAGITFREIALAAVEAGQFRLSGDAGEWLQRRIAFHDKGEGFFEQHLDDGRWIQLSERRTRSGGVASIRADITLLKQREDALRQAKLSAESTSRSMARFLATFSHEVRNGLNGIAGLAQLLTLDAESASQQSHADLMLQSTRRLTAVLTDLLDYLKNEAIGVAVKLEPTEPRALLQTLRAELEPQAAQRKLPLHWTVAAEVPEWVEADAGRILQVLANLAGNALKHAQHGTITIRLALAEKKLRFEVEDEGVGIAPDELPGLFGYFVKAGVQHASSTGLGLAICKQLVDAMGGVIGVSSEPDRGSRFWFDLPLRPVAAPAQPVVVSTPAVAITSLRVGIIDDDPLNRTVAQSLLLRLGHHAEVFEDGRAIADHLMKDALDVLLVDLMMPRESGFEIARRLRSDPTGLFSELVLVALTGNVLPDSLAACRDAGIDAILQKPLFIDQLQHVLRWAASGERRVSGSPEVFAAAKVAEVVGSAAMDAQVLLARLADDIGTVRFAQSVRSARKLFEQALAVQASEPKSLRRVAHRVAGTAPQLGFGHLGDCARAIDTLLGPSVSHEVANEVALATHVNTMRAAARDSLKILDEQLQRLRGKPSRA